MINVLINAYSVSPGMGSEPGMGWNWIINIATHCNVFVITEGEWKDSIDRELQKLPQKKNIHFYYNPVPQKIRDMCWNQGDWRFYWYYRKWQKSTYRIALKIIAEHKIDVIHQLNMIGFREPGYLWKIKDIPFIWGPVGGMGLVPIKYMDGEPLKNRVQASVKNVLNVLQIRYSPRVKNVIRHSKVIISAFRETDEQIKACHNRDTVLINETCTSFEEVPLRREHNDGTFRIMWVGRFIPTKKLDLALRALAYSKMSDYEFHICGSDINGSVEHYREIARNLGIDSHCVWHGKVDHSTVQTMMLQSDLLFFTSILEATSTVILEAISSGLPVLSFNICGFGPLVSQFAGRTIELSEPHESIEGFARELVYLQLHRDELNTISKDEISKADSISWEKKAEKIYDIYVSALK